MKRQRDGKNNMKKLFENVNGNQFKLNDDDSTSGYNYINPVSPSLQMGIKIEDALRKVLNDERFIRYILQYPKTLYRGTIRDGVSFEIALGRNV